MAPAAAQKALESGEGWDEIRAAESEREEPLCLDEKESDAVVIFSTMATQWRVGGMAAVRLGLEYSAIPAVAGMMGVTCDAELFTCLRSMEATVLRVQSERSPLRK